MIPFARIMTYGNTAPIPGEIVKINAFSTGAAAILYDNGNLYVIGANSFGQLGLGDTPKVMDFTLLDTGVTNLFLTDGTTSNVMVYAKGLDLYMCGKNNGWVGTGSDSDTYTTSTLITNLSSLMQQYSGVSFDGKVTNQNICIRIIKSNGDNALLISGTKNCILTGIVSSRAFFKQADNVINYSITVDGTLRSNCFYVLKNGNLFGLGSNSNGQISPNVGGVFTAAYLVEGNVSQTHATEARMVYSGWSQIKGRGANGVNSLGPGSGNVTTSVILFNSVSPAPLSPINIKLGSFAYCTVVGLFKDVIYSGYGGTGIGGVGQTTSLGSGSSSSVTIPTRYQILDDVQQMVTTRNDCFFLMNNKLYCTYGNANYNSFKVTGANYNEFTLPM